MGEQCSSRKPFSFSVFGVFRGLTCRSRASGSPRRPTQEARRVSTPTCIVGAGQVETIANGRRL